MKILESKKDWKDFFGSLTARFLDHTGIEERMLKYHINNSVIPEFKRALDWVKREAEKSVLTISGLIDCNKCKHYKEGCKGEASYGCNIPQLKDILEAKRKELKEKIIKDRSWYMWHTIDDFKELEKRIDEVLKNKYCPKCGKEINWEK